MYNPFVKLTKSQKEAADEYKHSPALSFFYGFIIIGAVLLSFSLHFEFRLIDILSNTSMRDDTGSLTRFEQFIIKRKGDDLESATKVTIGYQVSDENLELPRLAKQTLFLRIYPTKKFVTVYVPMKYKESAAIVEKNLHSCLFEQGHELKTCIMSAMNVFELYYENHDKTPFINSTPYIYTDKFTNNPF